MAILCTEEAVEDVKQLQIARMSDGKERLGKGKEVDRKVVGERVAQALSSRKMSDELLANGAILASFAKPASGTLFSVKVDNLGQRYCTSQQRRPALPPTLPTPVLFDTARRNILLSEMQS